MKHFKNPVAIRVPSQEAFETDLRKPLEELGAKFRDIRRFDKYTLLVSNTGGDNGFVGNTKESYKSDYNRHFIENYDPVQFIAICKLEIEMIVGECYTVVFNSSNRKMIGYLLENNTENEKYKLRGKFKGFSYGGSFYEKIQLCYSSNGRTIRLSTPEEKAKLDAVINEQVEVNNEIILTGPELKPKPIKLADRLNLFREEVKKYLDSYDETKLKIEKQIKEHEEEIKKLYSALKVLEALK